MKKIKYFTQKEIKKFFNTIEKTKDNNKSWLRDLVMFNIIYICGLRASEISLLKRGNYNINSGELFVHRRKGSLNNTIRLQNKSKLLTKYIKQYEIANEEEALFLSRNGKPPHRKTIEYLMDKYCRLAKLPREKSHPHTLKHSIAVHLAESGADIKELQAYLGHKKIDSTLEYFKYTTAQQDDFYEKINKRLRIV